MFAASVFIAMVKFVLYISFDLQKERTKERKNKNRSSAEIQVTVYCAKLRNFKSQIVLCAKAELLNFET